MFDLYKMNLIAVTLFIVRSYFGEFSIPEPIRSDAFHVSFFFFLLMSYHNGSFYVLWWLIIKLTVIVNWSQNHSDFGLPTLPRFFLDLLNVVFVFNKLQNSKIFLHCSQNICLITIFNALWGEILPTGSYEALASAPHFSSYSCVYLEGTVYIY